jgi:outer membrane protein assembly factor BamB
MKNPSTTYLFDKFRTGRLHYGIGDTGQPFIRWRFRLPSYPPKGPESMPAFDQTGNLYFGAHDHCFYSLDGSGNLRWMFKTEDKIYSSPTIINNDKVVFASGDGNCFCFDLEGQLLWAYDICCYFSQINNRLVRRVKLIRSALCAYDYDRRKRWSTKCWSSPNVSADGHVYITGYGLGLHAIRLNDGKKVWTYDLGGPRNHLSGVAINEKEEIFVASQRRYLHCLNSNGRLKWRYDTRLRYDTWANPSIDSTSGIVYFPLSYRQCKGRVVALDYNGDLKWQQDLPGGLRGSVAISYKEYILLCSLNGMIYFLNKKTGSVVKSVKLSEAGRALWTTPVIDKKGRILVTAKEGRYAGSLYCLDDEGKILWRYETGKTLSVPVVDEHGMIYIGSWNGEMLCLQS